DVPNVIRTPYFRSYWIQRNTAELRGYSALLSQLTRRTDAFVEDRVLVRSMETPVAAHDSATVELQKFIPDNVGLSRLWDTSSADFPITLIAEKFFAAGSIRIIERQNAPVVNLDASAGSEGDFQTRIDEAPKPSLGGALTLQPLKALVESAG